MLYSKLYILTKQVANNVQFISDDRQMVDLSEDDTYGTNYSIFVAIQLYFTDTKRWRSYVRKVIVLWIGFVEHAVINFCFSLSSWYFVIYWAKFLTQHVKGQNFIRTIACRKNCSTNLEESLSNREYVVWSMVLWAVIWLVKNAFWVSRPCEWS